MARNQENLSELLSAYLDGEVNVRQRAAVERALQEDPAARRLYAELRKTAEIVAALPRHAAPPNLAAELDAQLERAELIGGFGETTGDSNTRRLRWPMWFSLAAVLALSVSAGWWFVYDDGARKLEGFALVKKEMAPADAPPAAPSARSLSTRLFSAKPDFETQLAAGVDPASLANESFDAEQVRLRVAARNPAERDRLAEQLTVRLAAAQNENLMSRNAGDKQPSKVAGAFFVPGKQGVNFADPRQQQILVRVPRSQAEEIIDDVQAIAGAGDRIALAAGPVEVRGPESAKNVLRMMNASAQATASAPPRLAESTDKTTLPDDATAAANARIPPPVGLLKTLTEIVGLDRPFNPPNVARPLPTERFADSTRKDDDAKEERLAEAESAESPRGQTGMRDGAQPIARESDGPAPTSEAAERPRSLVARRFMAAEKARKTAEMEKEASATPMTATTDLSAPVKSPSEFMTLVIEFTIPSENAAAPPKTPADAKPTRTDRGNSL